MEQSKFGPGEAADAGAMNEAIPEDGTTGELEPDDVRRLYPLPAKVIVERLFRPEYEGQESLGIEDSFILQPETLLIEELRRRFGGGRYVTRRHGPMQGNWGRRRAGWCKGVTMTLAGPPKYGLGIPREATAPTVATATAPAPVPALDLSPVVALLQENGATMRQFAEWTKAQQESTKAQQIETARLRQEMAEQQLKSLAAKLETALSTPARQPAAGDPVSNVRAMLAMTEEMRALMESLKKPEAEQPSALEEVIPRVWRFIEMAGGHLLQQHMQKTTAEQAAARAADTEKTAGTKPSLAAGEPAKTSATAATKKVSTKPEPEPEPPKPTGRKPVRGRMRQR